MPSLETLKAKWFIDVNDSTTFPPSTRHAGALVGPHTDGNLIKPLIDGAPLMAEFDSQLQEIMAAEDPTAYSLWVSAMNIHAVKLLGNSDPAPDVKQRLLDAAEAGATVYYNGSGHQGAHQISSKFAKQLIERGSYGVSDRRFPPYAGQHQKFTVLRRPDGSWLATLGSADFFTANWDTSDHLDENPERPKGGGPIHNVSVRVQGPAVHDILLTYAERWNDEASWEKTSPQITSKIDTSFTNTPIPAYGPQSVQLVRIYGIESRPGESYSWADHGEFTGWVSYLNAIKHAEKYIYIEDQYFYPFGSPPLLETSTGTGRDSDIIYQLGEALKRGVDVLVLVPGRDDLLIKHYEFQYRRMGANYLQEIADNTPGAGRFAMCKLRVGEKDPIVHAKVMLVDDELALVGSTNIAQRSMCLCSEIHLAIVDEENQFATDLRHRLWMEHMELSSPESILDPGQAVGEYIDNARREEGRLRLLPTSRMKVELPYGPVWNRLIDPYRGPERT